MRVNRGLVFWGLALVTAGAVALFVQSGAIDPEAARRAWQLWPVVLIVIGLAVIAARTPFAMVATVVAALVVGGLAGTLVAGWPDGLGIGCGGQPTETVTESGTFDGQAADVTLRFNCGDLDVSMVAGSEWAVDARHGADARPDVGSSGDSLAVTADGGGPIGFTNARQAWQVELPSDVELALELDANAAGTALDLAGAIFSRLGLSMNAGDLGLDLAGARVDDLELDANAGSVHITTDDATMLHGSIGLNAGSLELCADDGMTVEVSLDDPNVTFSHNLDERGFTEDGDTWRIGSGVAAVRLEVDGNAASFSFNPDGGCS